MKRKIFRLRKSTDQIRIVLTSIILLISISALSAQITLEHTYNFSGTLTEVAKNEFKYYVQDVPLKQCRIYNEDHSLYKTINLDIPGAYYLTDTKYVTKHLFNNDDYIEILYIYEKTSLVEGVTVYNYGLKVVNELGTVLMTCQNGGFAEIKNDSKEPKLLAYQYIYSAGFYLVNTCVYSLGGSLKSAPLEAEPAINLYPNPASDILTMTINPEEHIIKGQLIISDMTGKQLSIQPITRGENIKRIETSGMSPGSYVITLISKDKIIASEKIEIK